MSNEEVLKIIKESRLFLVVIKKSDVGHMLKANGVLTLFFVGSGGRKENREEKNFNY